MDGKAVGGDLRGETARGFQLTGEKIGGHLRGEDKSRRKKEESKADATKNAPQVRDDGGQERTEGLAFRLIPQLGLHVLEVALVPAGVGSGWGDQRTMKKFGAGNRTHFLHIRT